MSTQDQTPASSLSFSVTARDSDSEARLGRITTPHGEIATPVFMPVGTQGTVKAMTADGLEALGAEIILGNTYHLMLRPGADEVARLGGLHGFTSWRRSMLTDSGGYQVFSLANTRRIDDDGVEFRSHLDGSKHFLDPARSMQIQARLGADIAMAFDECAPYPIDRAGAELAVRRTLRWATASVDAFDREQLRRSEEGLAGQALFGIVQGSTFDDLRLECLERLVEQRFAGYAIGGLSVGEPKEEMYRITELVAPRMPADRPRYLMGVGTPEDLLESVSRGVDMFDCVMPTRNARNGSIFTSRGIVRIKNARFADDERPLDESCHCEACRRYSRAYLRHLYASGEILYSVLATTHNLSFYLDTMRGVRQALQLNYFNKFRREFLEGLSRGPE